ncbi:GNAT family protein [soil metagenome]|jgi:RimJ/RimL family protein N-acetyltransferase
MRLTGRTKKLDGTTVELRRHDRRYYPLYTEWYGDPEIWRLTSWTSAPLSRSAVERLFDQRESSPSGDSFAVHVKDEREPIGVISLMNISEAHDSADLSVILGHPEDRDQGYGADAISTLLEYAFGELGLYRIGLSVFEFNEPAISTYEKLGFRMEGRLRKTVKRDNNFYDAVLMSILKPEWDSGAKNS